MLKVNWLLIILSACILITCKKSTKSEVVSVSDIKDWKKLLRTNPNVLSVFFKDAAKVTKLLALFDSVSVQMRGLATLAVINCGDNTKLCKKIKVSPKNYVINHYHNGEFNKEYDRKEQENSMILFLRDPKGDIPWSEDEDGKDVRHLEYPELKRLVRKEKLPIFAMFYAPWCVHCKRLKPDFSAAATELKGKVILAGIDCDGVKGSSVSGELNVTSYPTLLFFNEGQFKFKYTGEKSKKGIIEWLKNPSDNAPKSEANDDEKPWATTDKSPIAHLTTETFKPFIAQHNSVLVMFYAPWCGHCKAMKPEFSKSATTMEKDGVNGRLAAVDVTSNRGLGDEFGVKGFPTIVYFKNGNKTFEHPGLRKEKDIVSFMKDPKEPPPPEPAEQPWHEQESSVVHLTDGTFQTTLKRKKHSLVMFYAPWCGHCKRAKPEFTTAASKLFSNNKVLLGAMDCTDPENKGTCQKYEVHGYPTLMYFQYGDNPHKYSGGRTADDFEQVMSLSDPLTNKGAFTAIKKDTDVANTEHDPFWGEEVITHITGAEYQRFVTDKVPAFLMFYKRGCETCLKVQEQFVEAAKLLQNHRTTFGALDCTDTTICDDNKPSIRMYFTNDRSAPFVHDLTTRNMYNYILSLKDEL